MWIVSIKKESGTTTKRGGSAQLRRDQHMTGRHRSLPNQWRICITQRHCDKYGLSLGDSNRQSRVTNPPSPSKCESNATLHVKAHRRTPYWTMLMQ
eukprot:4123609-Ditylum_brightwellii.AAC.1